MDLAGPALRQGRRGEQPDARIARCACARRSRPWRRSSRRPSRGSRPARPCWRARHRGPGRYCAASLRAGIRIETRASRPAAHGAASRAGCAGSSSASDGGKRRKRQEDEAERSIMRRAPHGTDRSVRPRKAASEPAPAVIDAADAGAAFEQGSEARRVAALHIGAQPVEGRGQVALPGAARRAGAGKIQEILRRASARRRR